MHACSLKLYMYIIRISEITKYNLFVVVYRKYANPIIYWWINTVIAYTSSNNYIPKVLPYMEVCVLHVPACI